MSPYADRGQESDVAPPRAIGEISGSTETKTKYIKIICKFFFLLSFPTLFDVVILHISDTF